MKEIESRIRKTMSVVLNIDESDIGEGTNTNTVDGWDSIKHMNLVVALEEEFDIELSENQIGAITDYSSLKETVAKEVQG